MHSQFKTQIGNQKDCTARGRALFGRRSVVLLLPLLLSFALFPGNAVFLAVLVMFLVYEIVVAQFIEPMWYGASTGMS